MNAIKNNAVAVNTFSQRILALKKYVTPKMEATVAGEHHKVTDLIAIFQTCLDNRAAVSAKRSELKVVLADRAEAEAACRQIDKDLKTWVAYKFGIDSQAAHDFGYPPPKVGSKSVQTKMRAVQLSEATRKARHTMGKKEKQAIKGTLVAPETTPADPGSTVPPSPSNGMANTNGAPASLLNGVAH